MSKDAAQDTQPIAQGDDLYPREGSSYYGLTEPEEQKKERRAEKAKVLEALPFFKDLLTRLDKDIADTDSITKAIAEAKERKMTVQEALHGLNIARDVLVQMRDYVAGLQEVHDPTGGSHDT